MAARLGQIHQFMLSCELDHRMRSTSEKDQVSLGLQALNADLGSACRNAFLSTSVSPSRFQRDVAATLKAMGMHCEEEAVDPLSGYTIDILLRTKAGGRMFALEVDGESIHSWHLWCSETQCMYSNTLVETFSQVYTIQSIIYIFLMHQGVA